MSSAGLLRFAYYAYFSQPSGERMLYRAIRRGRFKSIVELGVGTAQRSQRLIEVALRYAGDERVCYSGIDLFEMRENGSAGLSLKDAHHRLRPLGAKLRLTPGDPFSALARTANSLTGTDMFVVSADQDAESLSRAWFYVPRMLHAGSQVFIEEPQEKGQTIYRRLDPPAVAELASQVSSPSRRAA